MKTPELHLSTLHRTPYGWPLRQLRVPQAHAVTRGRSEVIVAVIDLGYRFHPEHEGHLWVNPYPSKGDIHGWDCHDNDASLEYNPENPESDYHKSHHAFVVGEVIACAPACKVMIVRVGYRNPDSWWRGIDYAAEHGAKILIIPHGFIPHGKDSPVPLFEQGMDFSYPIDNPQIRWALDYAYDVGCLVFKGTSDNRGRRAAFPESALETVVAVGSSNRRGQAADIAACSDYVEIAAPAGERSSKNPLDHVWSTGGDGNFIFLTGGCMAGGFAGGVAALVMSRFPELSNRQIRQILRNTASNDDWDCRLGWGILNAEKAVSLRPEQLDQCLGIKKSSARLSRRKLRLVVENAGAFDVQRALAVVFSGDPRKPAVREGRADNLVVRQLGHQIRPVRGLHAVEFNIDLVEQPDRQTWIQVCSLDHQGSNKVHAVRVER